MLVTWKKTVMNVKYFVFKVAKCIQSSILTSIIHYNCNQKETDKIDVTRNLPWIL
jgi:hypothetical protein